MCEDFKLKRKLKEISETIQSPLNVVCVCVSAATMTYLYTWIYLTTCMNNINNMNNMNNM